MLCFSFNLVGQNLMMTSGQGPETQDVDEADWIHVQPGDRIGLWEPSSHRGYVPYDYCDGDSHPEDFGVTWALDSKSYGDFSPLKPVMFTSDVNCRVFSFKAVIFPVRYNVCAKCYINEPITCLSFCLSVSVSLSLSVCLSVCLTHQRELTFAEYEYIIIICVVIPTKSPCEPSRVCSVLFCCCTVERYPRGSCAGGFGTVIPPISHEPGAAIGEVVRG